MFPEMLLIAEIIFVFLVFTSVFLRETTSVAEVRS